MEKKEVVYDIVKKHGPCGFNAFCKVQGITRAEFDTMAEELVNEGRFKSIPRYVHGGQQDQYKTLIATDYEVI